MRIASPPVSRPAGWLAASPLGTAYTAHFDTLAARGVDIHAEARLVASLVAPGGSVLDAGCGTGRVAIRLAASGYRVAGVDLPPRCSPKHAGARPRSTGASPTWRISRSRAPRP